jgi:ABC-type dipeptide/oligopeptide/nickel transport system permease component
VQRPGTLVGYSMPAFWLALLAFFGWCHAQASYGSDRRRHIAQAHGGQR